MIFSANSFSNSFCLRKKIWSNIFPATRPQKSQLEMESILIMTWINTYVCLPLTILIICCVCCMVQRCQAPFIYYTNLLVSNLLQLCITMAFMKKPHNQVFEIILYCGVMASLYFKCCIALERYCFIACPWLDWLRQTKASVLVCVLVWVLCIVSVPLGVVLEEFVRFIIYALLPTPLFIFSLAGTIKALPAAPSVPTEEKRRIIGMLVVLLLNYLFMLPTIIIHNLINSSLSDHTQIHVMFVILFLLSPFVDLILFVFMWKGPIDRLLALLCCCNRDNTAADEAGGRQCE
uniref:Uncharacterized LOC102078076 n=2 Tax=Oreochromis niloticus TaxID=8128 RepID=I3J0N9_ORENI